MPLFSEHIANMYYGSSSPYSGSPYSYSSSVSPIGSSYSASYLNPGGNYSNHSSLGGYSRAPLTSRWITSSGRNYSPMLSTISERGSASPVRINSPRRLPLSTRPYHHASNYTTRPVNINTADIDVSKDKYRHKVETPAPYSSPPVQEKSNNECSKGPFMPRVDGETDSGVDSPLEVKRSTIQRGRKVVRLYTVKRKERDSPRKPTEQQCLNDSSNHDVVSNDDNKTDENEFMKWREKLSDDLTYKDKREKKSLGEKLVEKFIVKDNTDVQSKKQTKMEKTDIEDAEKLPTTSVPLNNFPRNKPLDRRCSLELMAEQANLLDSLIRSENLSTATLELNKVGIVDSKKNFETFESLKIRNFNNLPNAIKTTKSDHSLHDSLKTHKNVRDPKNFSKRRSLRKSSSGSSIRKLDSITEFPKEPNNVNLPAIEESIAIKTHENAKPKPKTKLKAKITGSVEVSVPKSPLKFIVENVTVEEKLNAPKKQITYSSEVEDVLSSTTLENNINKKVPKAIEDSEKELPSPEPENGNFWDKIGKRETVYLMKRKQYMDEAKEKHKRALYWFPEDEEMDDFQHIPVSNLNESVSINKEDNISSNQLILHQPNERVKEHIFDKKSNDEEILNSENSKQQTSLKNVEGMNILKEMTEEMNLVSETDINIARTKIFDAEHNRNLPLESKPEIDNESSEAETTNLYQQNPNIGKITSLETVNDCKLNTADDKKTESENSKEIFKTDCMIEDSPLQHSVPNIEQKSDNVNTKDLLENEIAMIDTSQTNVNDEQKAVNSFRKSSDKQKEPCPIHPYALQKTKEYKAEKDKIKVPCPVHQLGLQDVIEAEKIFDINKVIVPQKSIPDSTLESIKVTSTNTDNQEKNIFNTLINETSTNSNEITKTTVSLGTEPKLSFPTVKDSESKSIGKANEVSNINKTEKQNINSSIIMSDNKETSMCEENKVNVNKIILTDAKTSNVRNNLKTTYSSSKKDLNDTAMSKPFNISKSNDDNKKIVVFIDSPSNNNQPSTSYAEPANITATTIQKASDSETSSIGSCFQTQTTSENIPEVVKEPQDIPNEEIESKTEVECRKSKREESKAENVSQTKDKLVETKEEVISPSLAITPKKPVKEEKALRPLIATPRPLQKKAPQVIHSSDSSDTSSDEESSEEDDDSDSSEGSGEFFECDNNPDGRTSIGSNDSGFDSSAPASPAMFSQIKKDCDVNCHRKCEKLTANLCGVNQRLLVEALATRTSSKKGGECSATSSSSATGQCNNTDILEQQLEQSTAYDIYRKTGRFTPPARSIPRFRKYTVEDFQFIKVLGKGSFGKVLLAELRDTEYYYAVKCLKKDVVLEDDDVECTLIERKVLALGTNHPYLCHLFATFQTDSHLFFVMEYLNGGDLMFHIQQSGRFPEARGRFYAAEIVSGLKFLHKRGIVYRDLKLDNILLDYEGHVRIADFGMCKLQIYLDKTADTFCGTPDYMAPEIIKGLKYNQTVDWWSFGVLLYEMLIGQSPFSGCDEDELFWSICNEMPSYPRFLSREALTILTRLLDKDARTRLGGTECMHGDIRDQEFFHPIHWDRLERRELETPFRPRVRHPMDTQYFDKAFTGERPRLTAVEPQVLRSMDQEPFRGFSYTNPNTTDR